MHWVRSLFVDRLLQGHLRRIQRAAVEMLAAPDGLDTGAGERRAH